MMRQNFQILFVLLDSGDWEAILSLFCHIAGAISAQKSIFRNHKEIQYAAPDRNWQYVLLRQC